MRPTILTTCLLLITLSQAALAQPGTIDPTFGNQGMATMDIGTSTDVASIVLAQPDGKVIVAGGRALGWRYVTRSTTSVARFMNNGSLDPSFGRGGVATVSFGLTEFLQGPVVVQPDGKVIVTGSYDFGENGHKIVLARLMGDGTLDASFGEGGKVTVTLASSYAVPTAAAVQADGKIVVAGYLGTDAGYVFGAIRIKGDGSMDSTFAEAGVATTLILENDILQSMKILKNGNILVMGTSSDTINSYAAVARYKSNGSPDSSFNSDGIATITLPGQLQGCTLAGVLPGGRMIVAGSTVIDSMTRHFLSRVNRDGTLDSTFGTDGVRFLEADGKPLEIGSILLSPTGAIVFTGTKPLDGSADAEVVLARYDSNGAAEATFANNGLLALNTTPGYDLGGGLDIQANGNIVYGAIGIYAPDIGMAPSRGFMVLRSTASGLLDSSWGGDGITEAPTGSGDNTALSMTQQKDGKILVAGPCYNGSNSNFSVARFSSDGVPDASFGNMGSATTNVTDGDLLMQWGLLEVQSDGRIILGGEKVVGSVYLVALSRFTKDGELDKTFGTDGMVVTTHSDGDDGAYTGAVQNDDKIVVAGYSLNGSEYNGLVARYLPNGTIDSTFGTDGNVRLSYGTYNDFSTMAIQPDGKIVAAGRTYKDSSNHILLVRLNPDGTMDQGFGTNGATLTNLSAGDDGAYSMALQKDGKIVLGGFVHPGTRYNAAVLRYNANGTPDLGFGVSGLFVKDSTPRREEVLLYLALQPDGKILAGGYSDIFAGYSVDSTESMIFRLNVDGTLDNSFASNGILLSKFGVENPWAPVLGVQPSGKIIAAMAMPFNGQYDIGVVRLESGLSLGVDPVAAGTSINTSRVYPNRLAENSTVEFETVQSEVLQITLIDMQGNDALVIQQAKLTEPGRHSIRFNTRDLTSGAYILRISGERGEVDIKVTK